MPDMLWEDIAASFDIDGSVKLVYAEAAGKTPGMPLIRTPRNQGRPAAVATDGRAFAGRARKPDTGRGYDGAYRRAMDGWRR